MYNLSSPSRFLTPVPLGGGAYVALSESRRAGRGFSLSFIADGTDVALVGIPAAEPEAVLTAIRTAIPGAILTRIAILEWDDRLIDILNAYADVAPGATVVADHRVAVAVFADIPQRIFAIASENDTVAMPSGRVIGFLPSPFVFSPSALMAYDLASHTLFTNRLFEIAWDQPVPASLEEAIPAMVEYHRMYAPSSEFLRPVLTAVDKLDVAVAVTRTGMVFRHDEIRRLIARLSATEFFHAHRAAGKPSDVRSFSHKALATQVLFKLASVYGDAAVLETFDDSDIRPAQQTFEVAGEDDYRIWQRLFDVVYAKRGPAWLGVAEPLVDKLVTMYGVTRPSVYGSVVLAAERKATQVDQEKKELEDRVKQLEARLSETLDRLTRDPLSGTYNELFLRQYVAGFSERREEEFDPVLLYVGLDDVARLNLRYSKDAGDEAIKNLGYLLDRIRRPDDLVFRRGGPVYVVAIERGGLPAAQETLRRIREGTRDAEAFIEPLTVSAAVVRLAETSRDVILDRLAEKLLSIGDMRIRFALDGGPSAYVDENVRIESAKTARVLVVDDDPTALSLLAGLLKADNYEVVAAADGAAGLSAWKAKGFDFVVCERNVPKLDGFSLRQEVYAGPGSGPRLFVLLTYSKTRETVIRANLSEIDFVLEKPIAYEELAGLFRRNIRKAGPCR